MRGVYTTDFLQDRNILKLLQITKQPYLPFLKSRLDRSTVNAQQDAIRSLNIKLFNLKLKAEMLYSSSFADETNLMRVVSSSPHTVVGITTNVNTESNIEKVVSASVEEITDKDIANEYTLLPIFGEIIIQGEKIQIGFSPYDTSSGEYDSLFSIAKKINIRNLNVYAEVVNNQLVISSHQSINFADKTYGGKAQGLSLKPMPSRNEREIFSHLTVDNWSLNNRAEVETYSSYHISSITGNDNATDTTPLYGLQGSIVINDVVVEINPGGITDTLQDIADRINSIYGIGAKAEVVDGRLQIKSTDISKKLKIIDKTKGAYTPLGLTKLADEKNITGVYFERYPLSVISLASYQKNISYSIQEITGSSVANKDTSLGLSGTLTINDVQINIVPQHSLQNISDMINTSQDEVKSEIYKDSLVIEAKSPVYFRIVDETSGGERNGLGLGRKTNEIRSLSAKIISGNISASENTPLNISGKLNINNKIINIGKEYYTETLAQVADRINSTYDIGVVASVENSQLVIRSSSQIEFVDETQGGYGGGDGALGFIYYNGSYITHPHNAVFYTKDKVYSYPSNFTPNGIPLVKFILKSSTLQDKDAVSLQLTPYGDAAKIGESIISLIRNYNSSLAELERISSIMLNGITTEGILFRNPTIENLKQNLKNIFSEEIKEKMERIGFTFLQNTIDIDYKKFYESMENNFFEVMDIFTSQDGIAKKIGKLLENIFLGDGIPGVNVRDESRYSYYKSIRLLNFLFSSTGQIVNISV